MKKIKNAIVMVELALAIALVGVAGAALLGMYSDKTTSAKLKSDGQILASILQEISFNPADYHIKMSDNWCAPSCTNNYVEDGEILVSDVLNSASNFKKYSKLKSNYSIVDSYPMARIYSTIDNGNSTVSIRANESWGISIPFSRLGYSARDCASFIEGFRLHNKHIPFDYYISPFMPQGEETSPLPSVGQSSPHIDNRVHLYKGSNINKKGAFDICEISNDTPSNLGLTLVVGVDVNY
ncbi:hypothetical protein [Photobacterium leiognathi]|uniref:hypothetical protein n=1 Tax=Photobacterium leiognathi TaxID=553611 RepID=UPI002980EDE7|nr:hypothetical protein [Photobacterium leiognathi]